MKIKKVLVSLGIAMAMFLNTVCGYAHTNSVDLAENNAMSNLEYVNWINELELTEDDKEFLLQDEHFQDVYEQYAEQDIELNDIEVLDVCTTQKSARGTTTLSNGKVVPYSHVQPTKTHTYYANKLYSTFANVSGYASIANSFIPYKWSWLVSIFFSLPKEAFEPYFNTGYVKTVENSTVYTKDAYYKEGSKYYIGYAVQKDSHSISMINYYRDKEQAPHQASKSYNVNFVSPNYSASNTQLVAKAKKYYNTGWKLEAISYSDVIIR